MEAKFQLMLLEIERLAILANKGGAAAHAGLYAGLLRPESPERDLGGGAQPHVLKLALGYLEGLAKDTETYQSLTRIEREKFWR